MDADEIILCKENIQPLRQGRTTAQLGLALKAQNDKDVHEQMLKERESYELAIITYEGEDPLGPRYDYVRWIEQCCLKFGAESNMIPLLEDSIMLFKDDERYKQDQRFVELIIKYIDTQDNPAELYQIVHSQGIGTTCASLYKSWAEYLDVCQNLKGADQIYKLGIANNAQPVELLKELQAQFQLSVARRMLLGVDTSSSSSNSDGAVTERQRTVLGKLGKSKSVGSVRRSRLGPGLGNTLSSDSKNNVKINIYQEDEEGDGISIGTQNNKIGNFSKSREIHKENIVKPEPWNKGFPKKSHRSAATVVVPMTPKTPSFEILKDEDSDEDIDKTKAEQSQTAPTPITSSKVLKTRKLDLAHKTPIQLFQSPHINNNKYNMPKIEVYSGGREFSFEELRFAYYNKHKEDQNLDNTTPQRKLELNSPSASSISKNLTFNLKNTPLPIIEETDI